jgi:beta-mannanase
MLRRTKLLVALVLVATAAPVLSAGNQAPGASGAAASAACTKAPTWKATTPRFGISLGGSSGSSVINDLTNEEKRFGTTIKVVRTWDNYIPTTNVWAKRNYGSRWVVTSIQEKPQAVINGTYDSALRQYFSNAPTTAPIFWNYWHEPEDNVKAGEFTAAQFVAAWKHIADIAASYCRTNLYPTLDLMGWTTEAASKLNWKDYYPGSDYVSVLAWDPYNNARGIASSYATPASIFASPVAASAAAGKPFAIAETGSTRTPGDSSGTGRAAWLTQVASYLRTNKAVFTTYFQSTNTADFELRDAPGIAAWKAAMAS